MLVTQKTDALPAIITAGALITIFQIYYANGGFRREKVAPVLAEQPPGTARFDFDKGITRAHAEARQRGIAHAVTDLIEDGSFAKFNVGPERIQRLACYLYNLEPALFDPHHEHHERIEEPSMELEATYTAAYARKPQLAKEIESYSHFGIFTFIHNYHINWVDDERGRDASVVQQAMLDILFPMTGHDEIWQEFQAFEPMRQPEPIWQFSRRRYLWAKDQWPNLSDRITTIWTLQDFDLLAKDIDVKTVISVAGGRQFKLVNIPSTKLSSGNGKKEEDDTAV